MRYPVTYLPSTPLPAGDPAFVHAVETYVSETNKVAAVWACFGEPGDLDYRPDPKSSSVRDILKHEVLSERRFFAEFLGMDEPPPAALLPAEDSIEGYLERFLTLAGARVPVLAAADAAWWLTEEPFFDTTRSRAWIFWRRVLHTAHHRTQLTVYLRLLRRDVPPIYGPTADLSWAGADPTHSEDAAGRR